MMKIRCILFSIVVSLLFGLVGCADKYGDWQTVSIPEIGSIRVPQEWVVTQEGDWWYLTDAPINESGYGIYLFGTKSIYIWDNEMRRRYSTLRHFDDVEYVELISSGVFSSGGLYWCEKYIVAGEERDIWGISLSRNSEDDMQLVSWDNLVDEETLMKITESYRPSVD